MFVCDLVFSGHSSLSFSGNSYIKYRLFDWLQPELKVSLRIRTLQSRGLILFTQTEPCVLLQVSVFNYVETYSQCD